MRASLKGSVRFEQARTLARRAWRALSADARAAGRTSESAPRLAPYIKGVGRGWGEPMNAGGARTPPLECRTTLVGQRPPACKSGPTSVCLPRSSHALASGRAPSDARIAAFCRADFESAERLSHTTAALCPSLSLTGPRAHRRPHDAGRGACEVAFRSQGGRIHCGPDEPRLRPSWRLSSLSDAAFVHFSIAPPLAPGIGIRRPCIRLVFIFMSL